MNVENVFISINAKNFEVLSGWWAKLLDRQWDRHPMPSCHEWDLSSCAVFQVLDNSQGVDDTTVTLRVVDLDTEITRLGTVGIEVPEPTKVDGFDTLRFTQFKDPEGNTVGLLEGI